MKVRTVDSARGAPLYLLAMALCGFLLTPTGAPAFALAEVVIDDVADGTRTNTATSGIAQAEHAVAVGLRSGRGFASAEHETGRLRAFAEEATVDAVSNGTNAIAFIDDVLTFFGPRPGVVEITMGVNGFFRNVGGPSTMEMGAQLQFGTQTAQFVATLSDVPGSEVGVLTRGEVTGISTPRANINGTLHVRLLLNPFDSVSVFAQLGVASVAAGNSVAVAGFDHTAVLGIALPDDWRFTSNSGAFLLTPVPLPGAAGFALVALVPLALRRRAAQ